MAAGDQITAVNMKPHRILISLGEHHAFNDGLGEFSRQLCMRLARQAPSLLRNHGIELYIHLKEHLVGSFGDQVQYLVATREQRRRFPCDEPFRLWHSLHQLNRTLPPDGTHHRWVTVHDLNFIHAKNAFSRWRDMRRMRALISRTDQIITDTRFVEADVQRHLGWQGPLETISLGVTDLSAAPREPVSLPASRYLFHISRMTPSKNVKAILEMAAIWPERHLVFAGPDGPNPRAVAAAAQSRSLRNVTVLTSVSEAQKAWLYANCDGLIFPSLAEGFGLPVIEAMYFGKPVFLSHLTTLPEVGGDLAHYFDHFEPQHMRQVVETGLALHAAQERTDATRQWARRFSWDACATRYIERYAELGIRQ